LHFCLIAYLIGYVKFEFLATVSDSKNVIATLPPSLRPDKLARMTKTLTVLAMLVLLANGSGGRANWDKARWGIAPAQFQRLYPRAVLSGGQFAWLDISQISRDAPLARLIEPQSRAVFYFDYSKGYKLREVTFLVPHTYAETVAELQKIYGKQVSGDDDETACFDADGQRKAFDPSGVGHMLSVCVGRAVFADRRHRNAIYVEGAGGTAEDYKPNFGDRPHQFVRIANIAECDEC
jgi:hypothetical protein